jgi:hypothetical protein
MIMKMKMKMKIKMKCEDQKRWNVMKIVQLVGCGISDWPWVKIGILFSVEFFKNAIREEKEI